MSVRRATVPAQSRELHRVPVRNADGKGQVVYTQQSLFGMVQNVQTVSGLPRNR